MCAAFVRATPESQFARAARELMACVPVKGEDANAARARKRVLLAADTCPGELLRSLGPYLVKYESQLNSDDDSEAERFFLNHKYETDLKSGSNADRVEMSRALIARLHAVASSADAPMRKKLRNIMRSMLDAYLDDCDPEGAAAPGVVPAAKITAS